MGPPIGRFVEFTRPSPTDGSSNSTKRSLRPPIPEAPPAPTLGAGCHQRSALPTRPPSRPSPSALPWDPSANAVTTALRGQLAFAQGREPAAGPADLSGRHTSSKGEGGEAGHLQHAVARGPRRWHRRERLGRRARGTGDEQPHPQRRCHRSETCPRTLHRREPSRLPSWARYARPRECTRSKGGFSASFARRKSPRATAQQ
jgi:hypothetical protein